MAHTHYTQDWPQIHKGQELTGSKWGVMARTLAGMKPANLGEVTRYAKQVAYLGDVSKVMAAISWEFGADVRCPSAKAIQKMIDERKGKFINYAERGKHNVA